MKKMNKKKLLVFSGLMAAVLISVALLVINLTNGGSNGTGTDSSLMPLGTFFVIFVLPGIIAQQKKRRDQKKIRQLIHTESL
jgi:hypothetical protein